MQIWFLFHIDPYIKLIWVYFPFLKHRIRKREKSKFRKNIVLILIEILALYLIAFETFETSWDLTMCSGKLKILYIYNVRNLLHVSSLWFYQMKMKMCQTSTWELWGVSSESSSHSSLLLSGGHVCAATGQCHIRGHRACDQRNDNWGCHPCGDFTSQISLGNENAVYIRTTWILLCEFFICFHTYLLNVQVSQSRIWLITILRFFCIKATWV